MANPPKDYSDLLKDIKSQVKAAQLRTVVAANQQMLFLYWQMGTHILRNQHSEGWGSKIIDRLSSDLTKEFPAMKGFSVRNLKYMRKFAECYSFQVLEIMTEAQKVLREDISKVRPMVNKIKKIGNRCTELAVIWKDSDMERLFLGAVPSMLSWSHHIVLMDKVPHLGQRFWYMLTTLENGYSRNILSLQIDTDLFRRQVASKKITNFKETLPSPQTDFAQYMMKDPFVFDFVQAKEKADERDVERQLSEHITKFLLELGQGFAFVGRQVHLQVGGSDFYIDLLFYHLILHAYVVIELKVVDFAPEDAGKLNFYINLVNDKLKKPTDNDTIGILLCKGKNNVVAEYALRNISKPIGVSEYQFSRAVPDLLRSRLPEIEDLEDELRDDEV